jgi:hypothetical protein
MIFEKERGCDLIVSSLRVGKRRRGISKELNYFYRSFRMEEEGTNQDWRTKHR